MSQQSAKVPVEVPDEAYWRRLINCQDACPVNTDARGYVRAIANGNYEEAYRIARGPNPLASICGRICGAPCEASCRRGSIDAPISIRALKRFVTEQFGAENLRREPSTIIDSVRASASVNAGLEELARMLQVHSTERKSGETGPKVAIIGAGPAGLACGHDLALLGCSPVIFEMESVPAGMLYLGVPAYRLPRELIRAEVAVIEALGVDIRCGVQIGKDISFADLRKDFEAIVICVGAKRSRWLNMPGSDATGIMGGVDFLRAAALDEPIELGNRVVVVGGGNVAYDVGRTVLRQEQYDVSREALRHGARDVHLCCLESLEEMPADDVEIIEGAEEGILRHNSLGPLEFLKDDGGRVTGVVFQKVVSVYDEQKRFAPVFDSSIRTTLEADTVLLSVGQAPDLTFLDCDSEGVELDQRGWLKCDPDTLAAGAEGIFVAGDLAHGTKLLIHAVASGKQAARSVFQYLTGKPVTSQVQQQHQDLGHYLREDGYETVPRTEIATLDPKARLADPDAVVECGFGERGACREAGRCLDCGVNTIFDSDKCILCGGCADICPESCLRLVSMASLEGDEAFERVLRDRCGEEGIEGMSAIIKDETRCIRCALCAHRCPVDAITMERMTFSGEWMEAVT